MICISARKSTNEQRLLPVLVSWKEGASISPQNGRTSALTEHRFCGTLTAYIHLFRHLLSRSSAPARTDSPTDTCLAWNLTGWGLASVHFLRPYLDPDSQKGRLKATASRASRKPVHIPRRRCPPLPSGRHWSGATPGPHCHYVPASRQLQPK